MDDEGAGSTPDTRKHDREAETTWVGGDHGDGKPVVINPLEELRSLVE